MAQVNRDIGGELGAELSLVEEGFDGAADANGDPADFSPGADSGGQFHSGVALVIVHDGSAEDDVVVKLEHSDESDSGFEDIVDRSGGVFDVELEADADGEAFGRIDLTNAEIKRYVRAVATADSDLDTNADVVVTIVKGGATNVPVED